MTKTVEQYLREPTPAECLQLDISKIEAELGEVSVTASLQAVEAQPDTAKQKLLYWNRNNILARKWYIIDWRSLEWLDTDWVSPENKEKDLPSHIPDSHNPITPH